MGETQQFNLQPLWTELLKIYRCFSDICEKNGLRHWLAYGTALGAARHQGFIPWDDDFDVYMPRDDYNFFLKVVEKELPDHYKMITWKNTPEYRHFCGKVIETRRSVVEEVERQCGFPLAQGVFIDIFPLDGKDDNALRYFAHKYIAGFFIRQMFKLYDNTPSSTRFKTFASRVVAYIGRFIFPRLRTMRKLMEAEEEYACKYKMENTVMCGEYWPCMHVFSQLVPSMAFKTTAHGRFAGLEVPLPGDVDAHLTYRYGEWRKLPPKKHRKLSHATSFLASWKFGPTGC